jgi:hypothetical protein
MEPDFQGLAIPSDMYPVVHRIYLDLFALMEVLERIFVQWTPENAVTAYRTLSSDEKLQVRFQGYYKPRATMEQTSLSITCDVDWTGCDGSIEWVTMKFKAATEADGIIQPPAFNRPGIKCDMGIKKENNAIHILFR